MNSPNPKLIVELVDDLVTKEVIFVDPANSGKTVSDLIDDCLVLLLTHVQFADLVTNIPLVCKHWKAILPLVHRKRSTLLIYPKTNSSFIPNHQYQFFHSRTISPSQFGIYYKEQFNWSDSKLRSDIKLDTYLSDSVEATLCTKITRNFLNIQNLSLVDVTISPQLLSCLLENYRDKLKSLFLAPSFDFTSIKDENGDKRNLVDALWPIIDSMTCLHQLALIDIPFYPDYSTALPNVLHRLTEFHLDGYNSSGRFTPVLELLDESKLKRLAVEYFRWTDSSLFNLVQVKPGLSALTHLELSRPNSLTLANLQQITEKFPQLLHLSVSINRDVVLSAILPLICTLSKLTSFRLHSFNDTIFDDGCSQLASHRLESLQVFLPSIFLDLNHFAVLATVFPNVQQLYLDECCFKCNHTTDHEDKEATPGQFVFSAHTMLAKCSTCSSEIVSILNRFQYLPKIYLREEVVV